MNFTSIWHSVTEPIPKPKEGSILICNYKNFSDCYYYKNMQGEPVWFNHIFITKQSDWIDNYLKEGDILNIEDYTHWTVIPKEIG